MSRPPLDPFPVLFGAYVGGLAAFAVGAVPGLPVLGWQAGVAGLIAFAGTIAVAATRDRLAVELARTDWNLALILLPSLVLIGYAQFLAISPGNLGTPSAFLVLFVALIFGVAAYAVANRRLIDHAKATDRVVVEWTAAPPARRRWAVGIVSFAAAVGLIVADIAVHHPILELAPGLAGFLFVYPFFFRGERRYSVLPDGLYVQQTISYAGEFVPGSRLTGYRVTDDALVIDRWIPLLTYSSALTDVRDLDGITTVLDRAFESQDGTTDTDRNGPSLSDTD